MNKSELIDAVAKKKNMARKDVKAVIDEIFDPAGGQIIKALNRNESVALPGFGKFEKRSRAARMGRNPRTGASITVPASRTAAFSAGKTLKDSVR